MMVSRKYFFFFQKKKNWVQSEYFEIENQINIRAFLTRAANGKENNNNKK